MKAKRVESSNARRYATLLLLGLAIAGPLRAQDFVLLAEQSDAAVSLEGESRIRIVGITGTVALRTAKEGEMIYAARSLDNRREERPAALWSDGRTLELRPPDAAPDEPLLLEIAIPEELAVEIDLRGSHLQIAGLRSELELVGAELDVDARGLHGVVDLTVTDSTVQLNGTAAGVTLDARASDVTLSRIGGDLTLSLVDSSAQVNTVSGELNAHLENCVLQVELLEAGARVNARGGSVGLAQVKREVEARLQEASLTLAEVGGRVTVETDSDVEFRTVQAALSIDGYGGSIRGTESVGPVEIRADHATIALEQMKGNSKITGDGLQVGLRGIDGETTIEATSTSVSVENVSARLDIQTDFGDVRVQEASGPVRVVSRDGNVRMTQISGPLELRASGENVDVGWSLVAREQDQYVENDNGAVTLRLPEKALCRVEIESGFGLVESHVPAVQVTDDGKFASGALGGADKPLIRVNSAGNVLVTAQRAAPGP